MKTSSLLLLSFLALSSLHCSSARVTNGTTTKPPTRSSEKEPSSPLPKQAPKVLANLKDKNGQTSSQLSEPEVGNVQGESKSAVLASMLTGTVAAAIGLVSDLAAEKPKKGVDGVGLTNSTFINTEGAKNITNVHQLAQFNNNIVINHNPRALEDLAAPNIKLSNSSKPMLPAGYEIRILSRGQQQEPLVEVLKPGPRFGLIGGGRGNRIRDQWPPKRGFGPRYGPGRDFLRRRAGWERDAYWRQGARNWQRPPYGPQGRFYGPPRQFYGPRGGNWRAGPEWQR